MMCQEPGIPRHPTCLPPLCPMAGARRRARFVGSNVVWRRIAVHSVQLRMQGAITSMILAATAIPMDKTLLSTTFRECPSDGMSRKIRRILICIGMDHCTARF